jgi:hypothetical protein
MEGVILNAEARKEIAAFTLRVCKPLYWHDRLLLWPKEIRRASCFVVRFAKRLLVITADHVYAEFQEALARRSSVVCQLGLMPFDLNEALIDRDRELDIATFSISETQLARIPATAIDCTGPWPPPEPERLMAVTLAGFPEEIRVLHPAEKRRHFRRMARWRQLRISVIAK